ncbi:MAG: sigma-70 family RNA polymerase sigma factor [Clostridiales bacterium]|nr:sigma-70 family RNA polymerase sigma factor [Clostridiales bacterium]
MITETFINFLNRIMCFTSFVQKSSGFPNPLTQEEEFECIKKYKEDNDEEAKNKLIYHNLRLVAHIVKKYSQAGEADDLISVGTIGLIKAINTYELNKGSQLSTYAARCIENEILMLLRVNKKHNGVYSLEESLGQDKDGNEITLQDIIGNDVDELSQKVESKILSEELLKILKENLSNREYQIICMRFGLNGKPAYTQLEVAKKLGISRSYISRLENKALKEIRQKLNNKEFYID